MSRRFTIFQNWSCSWSRSRVRKKILSKRDSQSGDWYLEVKLKDLESGSESWYGKKTQNESQSESWNRIESKFKVDVKVDVRKVSQC